MDLIKIQLIELVKTLDPKETITQVQASNKIGEYKRRIVSETLKQLYQKEGILIKRGGSAYSLNPNPRIKPLGFRGNFH